MVVWPLPALAAVLPFVATWTAFALSVHDGHIEACNPFWDGCTSISRAARHGLGNPVFRAVMLPAATLQIAFWMLCRHWLQQQSTRSASSAISLCGIVAGLALILYATFLGTDGDLYRLLRRYGVTLYFAFTFLALLWTLRALRHTPWPGLQRSLSVIALLMLALGVASVATSAFVADAALKYRLENALEWQLGLWLCVMFAAFVAPWRTARLRISS